jgi:succinate dehydrogenase/fumarate reductase flavoprotein subunit|tara:strand:- start:426 stop:935 length:510 start_codon:yes stop_codon:yes gene_type:complete
VRILIWQKIGLKDKDMKISDNTSVAMPMRNLITIIGAVGVGVWAYFGVIERLNQLETSKEIMLKDIESQVERIDNDVKGLVDGDIAQNNEFRIKWPRGDLGSPPADSEQYMLIEFLSSQVESIQEQLESMMNNKVNITRLQTDMEKALADIEELKDKIRESNGVKKTGE